MTANAAYTNALTQGVQANQAAQAKTAEDAALITSLAQKHSAWQPAQSNVVQSQQAQSQQQAQPAQQTGPQQQGLGSLGSVLPQDANSYRAQSAPSQAPQQAQSQQQPQPAQQIGPQQQGLGSLGSMLPQDANSYRAQSAPAQASAQTSQQPLPAAADKAYAPLSPTNGPAILDHPELQKVTGAHNLQDTSMAVGDSPTFNAQQTYAAKGPNGQAGTFSLDRAGILQDLVSQGRGDLANGLVKQWTDADLQSEHAKQQQLVAQHATLAGHIAAFESLPESMKPQAYAGLIQQAQQEGINTSGFLPATYDPADKTGMAQLKDFEAQASTVAEREKAQFDKINSTINQQKEGTEQQKANEGTRHDKAEEYLANQRNQIEAQKAAQAMGGIAGLGGASKLMGSDFQAQVDPATLNTLRAIAVGNLVLPPRGQQTATLLRAANQAFPDVDIPGAQKLTKDLGASNAGTSGGIAEGSNKTLEHIGVMMGADQAGGQRGSSLTPNFLAAGANAVTNFVEPSANNAKAAWDQAHAATITEMSRSFKGGPPGESEVVRDMKNLSFNDPPAKKATVYRAFSDLLQGQTGAVESQRKSVYGQLDPGTSLLTSKAQKVYAQLHGGSTGNLLPPFDAPGNPQTQTTAPAPAAPQIPTLGAAAALKLAPGTHFRGTDGKEYVR
jgi:hypothetical protein